MSNFLDITALVTSMVSLGLNAAWRNWSTAIWCLIAGLWVVIAMLRGVH